MYIKVLVDTHKYQEEYEMDKITEMKEKQLRKIRFEIIIAMLNDDALLREQLKTYFK